MKTLKIFLIAFLVIIFLSVIVIPSIFLIFGIQSKPLVTPGQTLAYEDVERVKQLMRENNPRRLKPGDIKTTTVTERDLNLFLYYTLSQAPKNQQINAHVNLYQNSLHGQFSYLLPNNPFGEYLNLSTELIPKSNRFVFRKLKIGAVKIPGILVNFVITIADKLLASSKQYQNVTELAESVKDLQVTDNSVTVVYQWQPEVLKKLRTGGQNFLLTADERARLLIYSEQIARISRSMNGRTVSLSLFLRPLFQFAQQRAKTAGNPEAENRALILNLAAFSVGRNISRFIDPEKSKSLPKPGRVKLTLLGRDDLTKHFLVSAAITVSGGSGLAYMAGIFKELDDSRGGSGFSFADLAADKAGVKFAEMAIQSSKRAKLLQQRMSGSFSETNYMPQIDNLPEGIQELEFKRTYKDLDSETYRMVEAEIERRISLCRIYWF